ncbi:MAG: hypothetical protein U0228_11665 [Myxococcaceae bacterium]
MPKVPLRPLLTIAVIAGFQIGLFSAFEAQQAFHPDEPIDAGDESQLSSLGLSAEVQHDVFVATRGAMQSSMASMAPWYAVVRVLLALAGGAVFVLALRLRVLTEGRAEASQLLGRAALVVAFLRTIDGAQRLVVVRTTVHDVSKVMLEAKLDESYTAALGLVSAATVGWSLVVVSVFMALATYFRSERVRDALVREEG